MANDSFQTNAAFEDATFTATRVYCPHGFWPHYLCRTCYPLPSRRLRLARILCHFRLHDWSGRSIREGYNALGQSYEPQHVSRWSYPTCARCDAIGGGHWPYNPRFWLDAERTKVPSEGETLWQTIRKAMA